MTHHMVHMLFSTKLIFMAGTLSTTYTLSPAFNRPFPTSVVGDVSHGPCDRLDPFFFTLHTLLPPSSRLGDENFYYKREVVGLRLALSQLGPTHPLQSQGALIMYDAVDGY